MELKTHKTNSGGLKLYDGAGFRRESEEVHASAYPLNYWIVNYCREL